MVSTTVDIPGGDCANAFAYIPDLSNNRITVYSLKEDADWRVRHNLFRMDPEEGDFDLNGKKTFIIIFIMLFYSVANPFIY